MPTKCGVILCAALIFSGCQSGDRSVADGESVTRYYGFFKTSAPNQVRDGDRLGTYEISGVGVRADNGVAIGYIHEKILSVPLDCRLVILVNDAQQLNQALEILETLQREGTCAGRQ